MIAFDCDLGIWIGIEVGTGVGVGVGVGDILLNNFWLTFMLIKEIDIFLKNCNTLHHIISLNKQLNFGYNIGAPLFVK